LVPVAASAASKPGARQSAQISNARAIVGGIFAASPIPALSIAVMRRKQLLWAEAFGKADVELDVIATTSHRFRLGSVSKIITATTVAALASKSVVDLDAPISQYMPELPGQHRATTLRQLLTHRGGIRHYIARDDAMDAPGGRLDSRNYPGARAILDVFINDPLVAKPGELVSYSTFGYTLASLVLEAASQTSFLDLVRREIADPLHLASLSADAPRSIVPNRVRGYSPKAHASQMNPPVEGQWANAPMNNPAYKWAGGGLLSTPADLAAFGDAHLPTSDSLPQSVRDALLTVQTEATDKSPPLGLGWRIDRDTNDRLRWHHAGGQDGARASLVVYPAEGLSIAFATNVTQSPGDVNGPSAKLADVFAPI
jgi:CubicO group peptidase (beta-lactamase class C family)